MTEARTVPPGAADDRIDNSSTCYVVDGETAGELPFDRKNAERLLASGGFFWLDLHAPTEQDFEVLRDVFGFHPLALEDSEQFDERPEIDDYNAVTKQLAVIATICLPIGQSADLQNGGAV